MDDKRLKKRQKGLRSDNRVQVTLNIGRKQDGSPIRKSFYGATWTEANAAREDYKLKMRMGLVADSQMTVNDWVNVCLSLYRTNVNEIYADNDAVPYKRLQREIGRMRVADVRQADLQKLLNDISDMSYSTVSKYYRAIKLVFGKARQNKLINDNPADSLEMPKCKKGSHRALERWETDCILKNWNQHRCGIWAMLMLLCGLRRSEMMGLTWDNIDMKNRLLYVKQVAVFKSNEPLIEERAKSGAGIRVLPICEPLWECLNSVQDSERTGFVCTMKGKKQITETGFTCGWKVFNLAMQRIMNGEPVNQQGNRTSIETKIKKAEEAGKKYIFFSVRAHDLRHTFATALYDANVDVKSAQYYLGHSSIEMTLELYTHLSQERQKKQRSQLVSFLDEWLKPVAKNADYLVNKAEENA